MPSGLPNDEGIGFDLFTDRPHYKHEIPEHDNDYPRECAITLAAPTAVMMKNTLGTLATC
jgi:hypothetical protein